MYKKFKSIIKMLRIKELTEECEKLNIDYQDIEPLVLAILKYSRKGVDKNEGKTQSYKALMFLMDKSFLDLEILFTKPNTDEEIKELWKEFKERNKKIEINDKNVFKSLINLD